VFANEDQWEEFDTVLSIMRLSCDCDLHATVSERMNELWIRTKTESDISNFIYMTARAFLLMVLTAYSVRDSFYGEEIHPIMYEGPRRKKLFRLGY
jgi:hypothetical protein